MPAKKTRRSPPDFSAEFAKYLNANERAYACAEKAIALRQAGKLKAAKEAERRAKFWLRKVMLIEAKRSKPYRPKAMTIED